ncbi:hypothetical protein C0989_010628 [Termitomyces sp. Mn162]|nr:hypothetical protein C0989_010628 [Termitomyces sp. Mn162]
MSFSPVPASRAPIRRRRFFIFVALFVALLLIYGVPWELPAALKEIRFEALSRASIVYHTKSETSKVDEIYGLIYMVTEDVERDLTRVGSIDPLEPLNMTVYAGDESINWPKTVKKLNKKYPVVVFSKVLDDDIIKAILGRTTQHHTFPNILIRGKSIGGSDDLQALHAERTLTRVLEQAGASVRNSGTGK